MVVFISIVVVALHLASQSHLVFYGEMDGMSLVDPVIPPIDLIVGHRDVTPLSTDLQGVCLMLPTIIHS